MSILSYYKLLELQRAHWEYVWPDGVTWRFQTFDQCVGLFRQRMRYERMRDAH